MYAITFTAEDHPNTTAPTLDAAIAVIATAYGRHRSEVGTDDRSSSCGTVEQYSVWLAGSGDRGEPVATVTRMEPQHGKTSNVSISLDDVFADRWRDGAKP